METYNQLSTFRDQTPNGEIRIFTRDIDTGQNGEEMQYFVVHLRPNVHPQILTANNAIPETTESGDVRWAGNAESLQVLSQMATNNATRQITTPDGRTVQGTLIAAVTGGYHQATGAPTETIIHQGVRYHQNDWRVTLGINRNKTVSVGTFQQGMLDPNNIYMGFGGGPLCLYPREGVPVVAHTAYDPTMEEAHRYGPWNPLSVDHGRLDTDGDGQVDRIKFYNGTWPAIGVGVYTHGDGSFSLVHAYSRNISQLQLMKEFQLMGCSYAFPCDGDTKAEMVYRRGDTVMDVEHPAKKGISTAVAYYIES